MCLECQIKMNRLFIYVREKRFQSVGEDISSWWNESGNYSPHVASLKSELSNSPPLISSKPEIYIHELEKQIHNPLNKER